AMIQSYGAAADASREWGVTMLLSVSPVTQCCPCRPVFAVNVARGKKILPAPLGEPDVGVACAAACAGAGVAADAR
ncbi:hypothetical protein, partial [Acetobacter malorum]|uniref:hypothetical protein n=1 Tax=Acetobacter malorum TaxID=178901 RepID=UPI001E2F7C7B